LTRWSTGLDCLRAKADLLLKYELYFNLLYDKMKEYIIELWFTYNMDEKGFIIRVEGRLKRVFTKEVWVKGGCRAAL
jgi:hypothetical protein